MYVKTKSTQIAPSGWPSNADVLRVAFGPQVFDCSLLLATLHSIRLTDGRPKKNRCLKVSDILGTWRELGWKLNYQNINIYHISNITAMLKYYIVNIIFHRFHLWNSWIKLKSLVFKRLISKMWQFMHRKKSLVYNYKNLIKFEKPEILHNSQ